MIELFVGGFLLAWCGFLIFRPRKGIPKPYTINDLRTGWSARIAGAYEEERTWNRQASVACHHRGWDCMWDHRNQRWVYFFET